eukprot:TRINITY_DN66182_c0_g1_i1.p1 TRINITY_DN66182_c0_g1~~TRINITY_DN66182_c0_g1_i1.p1  ORF type:complete len:214 (+),score=30.09 TRINITY_DN66182_c0_g1_i1:73-714(+)
MVTIMARLAFALFCGVVKPPMCIASSRHCLASLESAQRSAAFEDVQVSMLQFQSSLVQAGIRVRTNVSHSIPAAVDDVWHCLCGGWAGADIEGTIWTDPSFGQISEVDEIPGAPAGRHRSVGGTVFETLIDADRTARTCKYMLQARKGADGNVHPTVSVNVTVSESSTPGVATVSWSDRADVDNVIEGTLLKAERLSTYAKFADLARICASAQ